jgi:hypothetical protein
MRRVLICVGDSGIAAPPVSHLRGVIASAHRTIQPHSGVVTVTRIGRGGGGLGQISCCRDGVLPLRCRLGSEEPQGRSGDEMALKVERVVDGSMHVEKALGGAS